MGTAVLTMTAQARVGDAPIPAPSFDERGTWRVVDGPPTRSAHAVSIAVANWPASGRDPGGYAAELRGRRILIVATSLRSGRARINGSCRVSWHGVQYRPWPAAPLVLPRSGTLGEGPDERTFMIARRVADSYYVEVRVIVPRTRAMRELPAATRAALRGFRFPRAAASVRC